MELREVIERAKAGSEKNASEMQDRYNYEYEGEVEKTAYEQGAGEAENMMKIAASLGDIIGNRIADVVEDRISQSFGYDPEVMKTASLQDVMYDALYKVAEQVGGTSAENAMSTALAEEQQIGEAASHHANLAAASASDAIQSLQQGDVHSATQLLATAGGAIDVAKQFAGRVPQNAAVLNHVEEAAQVVSQAADIAASAAQGE